MNRIAIIGNAGGGKSTLARNLQGLLKLPMHEVDQLQWQPGWERTPAEKIVETHTQWLSQPQWIIDGWGDWDALKTRFDTADTIVLVDLPIALHYWWAAKRQVLASLNLYKHWPPPGCKALPMTTRLFRLMWQVHRGMRPQLLSLVNQYRDQGKIYHLTSREQIQQFLNMVASEYA